VCCHHGTKRRDRARVLRGWCLVGIDGAVLFSSFHVAHSTDAPRCSSRCLSLGACASVRGEGPRMAPDRDNGPMATSTYRPNKSQPTLAGSQLAKLEARGFTTHHPSLRPPLGGRFGRRSTAGRRRSRRAPAGVGIRIILCSKSFVAPCFELSH